MQVGFVQVFTFQYEKINTYTSLDSFLPYQSFTFQYEKINTCDWAVLIHAPRWFTFQYEKINTTPEVMNTITIDIYIPIWKD